MNTCILLAGGIGARAKSDIPKQFVITNAKPIFTYAALTLNDHPEIDTIILVCSSDWEDFALKWITKLSLTKIQHIARPGKSRQHSIKNGLDKAAKFMIKGDLIIIHDAARPNINNNVLHELIVAAKLHGSSLPVLPIYDAVYISDLEEKVSDIVTAKKRYHGQTPVCIDFDTYYHVNCNATDAELSSATGTCTLLFNNNIHVHTVQGDSNAYKITSSNDIDRFINSFTQ